MIKQVYPIQKFENRELSIKEFNLQTDFWLFNLHIPQAVDINIEITYEEIIKLKEIADRFKKEISDLKVRK